MTQRVQVTGGYVGEVSARVIDKPELRDPADLSMADLKVCLVEVGEGMPTKDGGAWQTPTSAEYPSQGVAVVSLGVSDSTPPGKYYLWVLASVAPLSIPIRASNEVVEVV